MYDFFVLVEAILNMVVSHALGAAGVLLIMVFGMRAFAIAKFGDPNRGGLENKLVMVTCILLALLGAFLFYVYISQFLSCSNQSLC